MGKISLKSIFSEKGISLIEILVSIVLLSIIVVSFLTMFVQSAKTNKVSEGTLVATYVAQDTMECIYNNSKTSTSFNSQKVKDDCTPEDDGYNTTISIERENDLYKVLVVVLNQSTGRKEAQMETLLTWKQ